MRKITIASKNQHKVGEFQALLAPWNVEVMGLGPEAEESPENGSSFESNALEKAVHYAAYADGWVLADDSGLCVDALGGAPGIHSARYAGSHGDDALNRQKLLSELSDVEDAHRTGAFACAIAVFHRQLGVGFVVRSDVRGVITRREMGDGGFGYDPLFYLPSVGKTFAELSPEEKNRLSHRAKAVTKMMERWKEET